MKNNIYTILDLGGSKISCIIFEMTSKRDEVKILGASTKCSAGIYGGVIENITDATAAISLAVYEAEKQASVVVKKIVTNVAHPFIQSRTIITDSNFGGKQLLPKNLKDISDRVLYSATQSKHSVIKCCPVCYDVDTMKSIADPEYMFVNNLKSYHTVISVPKNILMLLKKTLKGLHLNPSHFVISSCASRAACCDDDLRNVVMLDIGGSTSDIAVFREGQSVLWAGSVPLGGDNITKDIAECFAISYEEAEKLKILYGNLAPNDSSMGAIKSNIVSTTKVDPTMLNKVILARIEEIFEIVLNKIPDEYKMKTMILSGGVAKTLGISEFVSTKFNIVTRIIRHSNIASDLGEVLSIDPSYSTAIGMIQIYLEEANKPKSFSIKKIFQWMWENF